MSGIRELLLAAHKRAQDEADIRRYELEEYERANGFVRPSKTLKQEAHYTYGPCVADKAAYPTHSGFVPILSPVVAPEAYTRRNAEDIHD